jgi:asparagine synthase (glutamine-hydrolysing)
MCGIVGIFDLEGQRDINRDLLITMRDTMVSRGPDEAGAYYEPGIGLGHRRLSIIDLASGQQPLSNQDNSVTIVFNGEIYNYRELTQELQQRGYSFSTHSDTETIVHAWEEWGEQCVDRLRGMFAFAIWDKNKKTLFFARDRLGIKPLLYAITDDGFLIFASEHKALLACKTLNKKINERAIETYFALGYIAEPETIYNQVHKLPAGHILSVRDKRLGNPQQYWDVPFKKHKTSWSDAQQEFIQRLNEAIRIRMIAEVPLGAFLSGGVDSSSVVALMSMMQQSPINTCSIGFDVPDYNESEFAQQVAERYKTNHHVEIVSSDDFSLIDTLVDIYDEPYADSSALPTYRVCELARKHVTVALSGDGADELMSGYRRHRFHMHEERIRSALPYFLRSAFFGTLGNLYPKLDWAPQWARAKSTFQSLGMDSVAAYFNTVSQNNDSIRDSLFSKSFRRELDGYRAIDVFRRHAENSPTEDPLGLIQYLDLKTYLIDDILTKVDRASMANSLEVRVPILDHQLVEWISGLNSSYKFNGNTGKALLKSAMEPHLPHDILYRKKMGFSVPLARWFRTSLKERVRKELLDDQLLDTGWFQADYIRKVVSEHQSSLRNHSTLIWSLLMFSGFLKQKGYS